MDNRTNRSFIPAFNPAVYRSLLKQFLDEDIGAGDLSTAATVAPEIDAEGRLVAKTTLVLAGLEVAFEIFRLLDPGLRVEASLNDGDSLAPGDEPAVIRGRARALLSGERVALNLLQRLSGIATLTRRYVDAVAGTKAKIFDTRKTTPGLRDFEKYAVKVGGGSNHRSGLYDAVLIKENHIRLAGGVSRALMAARSQARNAAFIEVEVTTIEELNEAIAGRPDIILLDNMTPARVADAVDIARRQDDKILIEASGGITLDNVRRYAEAGVDRISVGALTHSALAADISLEIDSLE